MRYIVHDNCNHSMLFFAHVLCHNKNPQKIRVIHQSSRFPHKVPWNIHGSAGRNMQEGVLQQHLHGFGVWMGFLLEMMGWDDVLFWGIFPQMNTTNPWTHSYHLSIIHYNSSLLLKNNIETPRNMPSHWSALDIPSEIFGNEPMGKIPQMYIQVSRAKRTAAWKSNLVNHDGNCLWRFTKT